MAQRTTDPRDAVYKNKPADGGFLFPLSLPIVHSVPDPMTSRLGKLIASSTRFPPSTADNGSMIGSFGGPGSQGGFAPNDDLVTTLPANLRVSFILQQMKNEVVSGDGVDKQCFARWETHGSAATEENGGLYALPAPLPGETWPVPHANGIYDALVQGGCGSTPIFPVEFHSSVGEQEDFVSPFNLLADFSAIDESTLQPNGFWTFAYTIRATGTNRGVSDFKFRGIVSVTCTILQVLPN